MGVFVRTKGILPVELRVGTRTSLTAQFVVKSSAEYNALLGQDWIHPNFCIPFTLHQFLIFWNGKEVEVIGEDNKSFVVRANNVEALLYEVHIGPVKLIGTSKHGGVTPENKMTRGLINNAEVTRKSHVDSQHSQQFKG